LIWCTTDPRINRITLINHLNPARKTDKRGKSARLGGLAARASLGLHLFTG